MQFWFKKSFKIFLVLIAVWFVSIFTLLKYPLSGFGDSILSTTKTETTVRNGKTKSAKTLRRIDDSIKGDDKKMNKSRSAFRGKFLCKVAYFMFYFFTNNPTNNTFM